MPELVLGPLLRYAGETNATVWVETDTACEVEVLGCRSRTFHVEGHHYALVHVAELEPGAAYEYEVFLDGERRWPEAGSLFPPAVIRTWPGGGAVKLVFGSCRISAPHEPPHTLSSEEDERGLGVDALYAMAMRLRDEATEACRTRWCFWETRSTPTSPVLHARIHPFAPRRQRATWRGGRELRGVCVALPGLLG